LFTASRLILADSVTEHASRDQRLRSLDDTVFVAQFFVLRSKLDLGLSRPLGGKISSFINSGTRELRSAAVWCEQWCDMDCFLCIEYLNMMMCKTLVLFPIKY